MINIQNIDDHECFKRRIVRYLNPVDGNLARVIFNFKDIKFPVKIWDIHKSGKKNSIDISVFGNKNKEKYPIYVPKKCFEENHIDLLFIGEEGKKHYVLIKDFKTFMYNHTLHRRRNQFCCYCLQAFTTEEILKYHTKDCFIMNDKQKIIMLRKGEYVKFKNYGKN